MERGRSNEFRDDALQRKICDKVTMPDFHATILHLLGLDHERLTCRFGGRDHRLTDVHCQVARAIIA
jgi:hypothetical protein